MPIFALANAGVAVGSVDLSAGPGSLDLLGIAVALVLGKPLGIVTIAWLAVRFGGLRLSPSVSWGASGWSASWPASASPCRSSLPFLPFPTRTFLAAAKLGVLLGLLAAALLGLAWGAEYVRKLRAQLG